jgi:alpha-tubulin suppressor-like RCC1 family protein
MKYTNCNSTTIKWFIICAFLLLFAFTAACTSPTPPADNSSASDPDKMNDTPRFTQIAALGYNTGLALRDDGKIVCWGWNYQNICDIPRNLTTIASIYPMNYAITTDGTVVSWGGPMMIRDIPSGVTDVVSITSAQYCSLALTKDGTVIPWNCRLDPKKELISNRSGFTNISGNLGLKKDRTVVTWINDDAFSSYLGNLSNVVAISNQGEYYGVLKDDGTIVAWKVTNLYDNNKELIYPISVAENLTDVRALSAGSNHILALNHNGTVVSFSTDTLTTMDYRNITAISAGHPDLALRENGSLVAGSGYTNVKSISAGRSRNIVLKNDGTTEVWGFAASDQSRNEKRGTRNITGILADEWNSYILINNETLYGWSYTPYGPFPVQTIPHPRLTLFRENKILIALNDKGNINVLSKMASSDEILQKLDNVTDISSNGGVYTIAIKTDGTVTAWGESDTGAAKIPRNLSSVIAVAAGPGHALAVKSDGTVIGWGDNGTGQTNVPPGLTDVIAISAGEYHSLALKKGGTVVAWGGNENGECNVPENLHDVIAISAGWGQSLALKKDGTVVAWGMTVIPDWYG